MRILIVCVTALVTACTSTGVVPAGSDTFMIGKKSAQIGFGPPIKTEAAVFAEASDYCVGQGKKVETVDLVVRNTTAGRPGSVNLKFRCVYLGEPQGNADVSRSIDGIDQTKEAPGRDKYAELERLRMLLDDGTLTQQEFEKEKAKILND